MSFPSEPQYYKKTALADLKGAWEVLRSALIDADDTANRGRLLFHIDEAMSWECVRDLNRMHATLTLIRNIAARSNVSPDVTEWIDAIGEALQKVFSVLREGEKL